MPLPITPNVDIAAKPPTPEEALQARSRAVAERTVEKLFAGRKGHGGGPCSYRNFRREELHAVVEAIFEIGFNQGVQSTKAPTITDEEIRRLDGAFGGRIRILEIPGE